MLDQTFQLVGPPTTDDGRCYDLFAKRAVKLPTVPHKPGQLRTKFPRTGYVSACAHAHARTHRRTHARTQTHARARTRARARRRTRTHATRVHAHARRYEPHFIHKEQCKTTALTDSGFDLLERCLKVGP